MDAPTRDLRPFSTAVIGKTAAEVAHEFGGTLGKTDEPSLVQLKCYFAYPEKVTGKISLMVVGGVVVRMDVQSVDLKTARGVGVGSTKDQIFENYDGVVKIEKDLHILGNKSSLYVDLKNENKLLFILRGENVVEYRIGRNPFIEWMSGCY